MAPKTVEQVDVVENVITDLRQQLNILQTEKLSESEPMRARHIAVAQTELEKVIAYLSEWARPR